MVKSLRLIIKEEEQLILDDRPTNRAAEHVPAKLILGYLLVGAQKTVLPVVGIQHVIAEIFPQVSVEAVGAGLDRGVDGAALGTLRLQDRRRGRDLDGLRYLADLHLNIDTRRLVEH